MRPNPGRADADSHLWPCPQCGSDNGLNAHACWNCDASLPPPGDALALAPITAALEAQGVPMPEFEGHVAHPLSMASIERRPAPTAPKRRTLFEAAAARLNGEPDEPSDAWSDASSEALPGPETGKAVVDIGIGESGPDATPSSWPSMLDRSTSDPLLDAAPADPPAVPSFADEPFDESRFAVKSFDAWAADDGTSEPDACPARAASNEATFPERPEDAAEAARVEPAARPSPITRQGIPDAAQAAGNASTGPTDSEPPWTATRSDPVSGAKPQARPDPHAPDPPATVQEPAQPSPFPWRTARPAIGQPQDTPADLAATLTPIDEAAPPRFGKSGGGFPHVEFLGAAPVVADPTPTPTRDAAGSPGSEPPLIVASDPRFIASDPPFEAPRIDPLGARSAQDRGELPSDLPPPVLAELAASAARKNPAPAARRSRPSRSPEAEAIQTFEDSFFAAGTSHPPIHSDDDASFDSGRSGLGSTQPPIRGGRDVDAFGPLPSARAERDSDSFRDEALGAKFAALSSTAAQAARRRRRVTIATLCLVVVAVVLAAYPFFGDGVRVNLSSDELRSAASMSTTPAAPTPVTRVTEPVPSSTGSGVVSQSPPIAVVPTPAPNAAPVAAPRVARADDRPAPAAQTSGGETRPTRVPREVAERLARRQTPPVRTQADAAVTPTAERTRSDTGRPRTDAAGQQARAERASPGAEPATEARANRRRGADETATDTGGSITCTERILALNLCGPRPRKE